MILGSAHSFVCLVVDRHKFVRGRWDGRPAFDIAIYIYIGPLGLHFFWPDLGQSYTTTGGGPK